jgi:hypothetical protein
VKIRGLLRRQWLRLVTGEREAEGGPVDALATTAHHNDAGWISPPVAPTNWVPSQQDERPH